MSTEVCLGPSVNDYVMRSKTDNDEIKDSNRFSLIKANKQQYSADTELSTNTQTQIEAVDENQNELLCRQTSLASFQNLSISHDAISDRASQLSSYEPVINKPYVDEDASAEEKEIHAFLDSLDIFQINVKSQLRED